MQRRLRGVRPNTALAEKMNLHVNRGIVVSDTLQTTTDPRIYAVGECANHRGTAYGLVAPLFEQATVCATHLARFGIGRYSGGLIYLYATFTTTVDFYQVYTTDVILDPFSFAQIAITANGNAAGII